MAASYSEALILVLLTTTTQSICEWVSKGKVYIAYTINHSALPWSCGAPATNKCRSLREWLPPWHSEDTWPSTLNKANGFFLSKITSFKEPVEFNFFSWKRQNFTLHSENIC